MDYTTLLFDLRDHVAHVTLNRPEASNTLNRDMARDLMHVALCCDADPAIRAVLLSGAGPRFCAGGDLSDFAAQADNLSYHVKEVTTYLHAAMSRFARMEPPLVAAVHGAAAGAGLSLALASDLVVAGESARFVMAYTRAGLAPDGSSTYYLPRVVGFKRALELALTNRTLSAREALDWGIVTRVVPDADVLSAAHELALQLAAGATTALGAAKRLLHRGWTETLETQMEHEAEAIATMARTRDAREGITAFLEKRPPKFTRQ